MQMKPNLMSMIKQSRFFSGIIKSVWVGVLILQISCNQQDKHTGLIGAGSSFDYPLFSAMFAEYHHQNQVQINYQSIGSGGGILQLINKTIDFGASDAPLNEEQSEDMKADALHIPVCMGAAVVSYQISGIKDTLNFSAGVLADIYLGKIKNWDDEMIRKDNPQVKLPNQMITVIHRSDGSGTSFIFTDFLSKVSANWKNKVGKGTAVNWPAGLGGKGNEGVAGLIKQTPGSIGYVELSYALENKMDIGRVRNQSDKFIFPDIDAISASAEMPLPKDAKASITNTLSPEGYPVSSFSWALIYKEQAYKNRSNEKAEELLKLLWWVVHDGQRFNAPLHYAPLSGQALKVTEHILKSATYEGKTYFTITAMQKEKIKEKKIKKIVHELSGTIWDSETQVLIPLKSLSGLKKQEKIFNFTLSFVSVFILLVVIGIFLTLLVSAIPAIRASGFSFFWSSTWDPVKNIFGSFPFVAGTLLTSFLALFISIPFSLGVSLYLGEYAPKGWFSLFLRSAVDLMAGIPSVIYGFWALFILVPLVRAVELKIGVPAYGVSILTASLVLSIMIIPYAASLAREVISMVPKNLKEAAYAMGATRYEMIKMVVLNHAKSGLFAASLLSLGRALGETMAVTMVIGNSTNLPRSLFAPGNTMASVIANEFTEAASKTYFSALIEVALLLFLITALINYAGKKIMKNLSVSP